MRTIFKTVFFLLILLIGIAAFGVYWTFYKTLPSYDTTITLNGLNESVDIHWDPYGTPYIYASNEDDLYFTIGYIHAQERLWQMTLSQISSEGRFAEFLGEELVPYDIHQRTIGFWETAGRIESEAPDSLLHILQRYADGVNHFVDLNRNNLPLEFTLLSVDPIEWTPRHSIALSRLMAWDQNVHWLSELSFAYISTVLDPFYYRQIVPVYEDEYPVTAAGELFRAAGKESIAFLDRELNLREIQGRQGYPFGSNAWAVNGSRTESGLPLLAGDPHMGLSIPGFWFEVFYHTPDHHIAGATLPGAPFVVLGQNRKVAWSMTNMMADDTDFFLEQINPDNPRQYISDSTSVPVTVREFEKRNEIIRVKDGDDKLHVVKSTQNGPEISEIHPSGELLSGNAVTLRWKGHDVSQELWALYKMNRAKSIGEFQEALRMFESPAMNFTYADADDNIAVFSAASLPVREFDPLTFRRGWDPAYRWQNDIPFDELPHQINPETGFVAHANNKLHDDTYPHYIATFWESPSRIMRIEQLLNIPNSLSLEWMQGMQVDVYSEHAREITEIILPILRGAENPEIFGEALPYLANWDYEFQPASTAASIFDLFFMNLAENTLKDELGDEAYFALIRLEHLPVMIVSRMLQEDSSFFNIQDTPEVETRADIVRMSMLQTLEELEERFGPETYEWRWENLNTLTLRPPLLGEFSDDPSAPRIFTTIVNNLFNKGPYPGIGHAMSINKSQYSWHRPFEMEMGATIRRIVDFSSPERSLSVLPTGQSGNPLSANYGDQTNLWLEGRYRYIYHDSTFFQQTSYQTMRLLPKN